MSITSFLGGQYHYIKRYRQIMSVFVKYGFDDLLYHLEDKKRYAFLRRFVSQKRYKEALNLSKWEKIRKVCEELGPSFVKFAQILSARPDLIPGDLIKELEKLQDHVPPFASEEAKQIIEDELHKPVSKLFASFDDDPFASASIAQVHKATLITGEKVIVKVQRPNIKEMIEGDIHIMKAIAEVAVNNIPSIRNFNPVELIKNYEKSIQLEMDFINESINLQRFEADFQNNKNITVPTVYKDFTTDKVITMQFVNGIKVHKKHELIEKGHDPDKIAKEIVNSVFDQIFSHGFFHADPHAGNILVLDDGTLCFIDFGMMGTILRKDVEHISNILVGIEYLDVRRIIRSIQQLSGEVILKDRKAFEYDIFDFVHQSAIQSWEEEEVSNVLIQLKDVIVRHELNIPAHFFLLTRSLVTMEGVAHNLSPGLDMRKQLKPYMTKLLARRFSPVKFFGRVFNSMVEFSNYIEDLPMDIKQAIQRVKSGEISVNLEHKGIDPLLHEFHKTRNQITVAVFSGSLIIGSSLIILAKVPPLWNDVSVWGQIGMLISFILGIRLFFFKK